ncbi:MAG: SGNH/GDSL hydrolase family protein [Thalassotalea sp.]|nr:SGNH/GDSL hydrolase family protein [Thalassotalea sp.]
MFYQLLTILIAPLIMAQAFYVKRTTLRLPEPKGSRNGVSGTGPKTSILIVGDSAAAGVGVETQEQALTGNLVDAIAGTHEVSWQMIAKTGDTSQKLFTRLDKATKFPVEYVLVSIGVNDVTSLIKPEEFVINLTKTIELLKKEYHARHILITKVPPMHLFPALPQPLRWWLGVRAKNLNDVLRSLSLSDDQCDFIDLALPFDKGYMAKDGFHPGAAAYELWGQHVAKFIQAELAENRAEI